MAVQMHVAYSSLIMGVGAVAGSETENSIYVFDNNFSLYYII